MSRARELLKLTEQEDTGDKVKIFAFETLVDNEYRQEVMGTPTNTSTDHIAGWEEIVTSTEDGTDYHTIVPAEGGKVMGITFDVTPEELINLDASESGFTRKGVNLASGQKAQVYLLNKEYDRDLNKSTFFEV